MVPAVRKSEGRRETEGFWSRKRIRKQQMVEKWQGLKRRREVEEYMLLNIIEKWEKASEGE